MIYFLRNISIRLCISVLISMIATFTIFPTIQHLIPTINTTIFYISTTIFILIITGYLMNIVGQRTIYKYINNAKNWERDGIFNKSEAYYLKALEIFDSYLLTLLASKKISLNLTGAIAKFSLTTGFQNDNFDKAATFFLLKNPQESEVAYLWLKKIIKEKIDGSKKHSTTQQEENLITTLAEMEPLNQKLAPLLFEIFTKHQRSDFAANIVFSFMEKNIEFLETAKYLNLSKKHKDAKIHLDFEGSEISQQLEAPNHIEGYKQSKTTYESDNYSEEVYDHTKVYKSYFKRRLKQPQKRKLILNIKKTLFNIKEWSAFIVAIPMYIISFIIEIMELLFHTIFIKLFKSVNRAIAINTTFSKNIKKVAIAIVVTALFMNTISYLFRTPPPPTPSQIIAVEDSEIQIVPQKKFTIQIAAYLVKSHAEKYLSNLEKKGVSDGYITEVQGGGKTWYLIRVGKYDTKESATKDGNRLKTQRVINDFFVDNSNI